MVKLLLGRLVKVLRGAARCEIINVLLTLFGSDVSHLRDIAQGHIVAVEVAIVWVVAASDIGRLESAWRAASNSRAHRRVRVAGLVLKIDLGVEGNLDLLREVVSSAADATDSDDAEHANHRGDGLKAWHRVRSPCDTEKHRLSTLPVPEHYGCLLW